MKERLRGNFEESNSHDKFLGLSTRDIVEIHERFSQELECLNDSKILLIGGTGFVGRWLLATLLYAKKCGTRIEIFVISRKHASQFPELSKFGSINWITQDVSHGLDYRFDELTHVINGATPSTKNTGASDPKYVYDTIVNGTDYILKAVQSISGTTRYINLSSGAATKLELAEPEIILRECPASHISNSDGSYSHGKLISEFMTDMITQKGDILGLNLRMYAFAGPGIALDAHFAAGNFILSALKGEAIEIKGNPKTERSYMYPIDLIGVILKNLVNKEIGTIEVGSGEIVTIENLAQLISRLTTNVDVIVGSSNQPISSYFPRLPTQLSGQLDLRESILRWWEWLNS